MRIVAALGGNALLRRGEAMSEANQRANIRAAVAALMPLVRAGHSLFVTHGNGPQIGMIALQNLNGPPEGICGLDVLGAQSQGMIGYLIEQEMRNALPPGRSCATMLTQVLVHQADERLQRFEKPVGPLYGEREADRLRRERGWTFVHVGPAGAGGAAWRRAVPSPKPCEILGIETLVQLADNGTVVICLGGGGVPVVKDIAGRISGVEAVVDKDHASALLARGVGADALLLLTDVEGVLDNWATPTQRLIRRIDADTVDPVVFEAGSMRPKVAAARDFVLATGKSCAIGRIGEAGALLAGQAGTLVARGKTAETTG